MCRAWGVWDLVAVLWPEPRHPEAPAAAQHQLGWHPPSAWRAGRVVPLCTHLPRWVGGQLPFLWEPRGLCLDRQSVWLLMCQSPSMGQGAFKANLPARHRRRKGEPSIFSGWGQGSEVRDDSSPPLPAPNPQVLGGRAGVREEATGLSISFPNAPSPLKRDKGPGLSTDSTGPVFPGGCPKGEGAEWSPSGHPLAFSQNQGRCPWPPSSPGLGAGRGYFLGQPAAPGGPEAPSLSSPLSQA